MSSLELARWQFGITTLYHFIFVPITIGLAAFTHKPHGLEHFDEVQTLRGGRLEPSVQPSA